MRLNLIFYFLPLLALLSLPSCEEGMPEPQSITALSITLNGANLVSGADNIPIETTLDMVFSSVLSPVAFESQLSITSSNGAENIDVSYSVGTSKATINLMLDYETTYTITVGNGIIGANGSSLAQSINRNFTTAVDDVIRSLPPCTTPSQCLQSVSLDGSTGSGLFEFYSNYPIYEENAEWENLTQAVIVVHGASHNPDDYFSYLTNTLNTLSLSENTVLISPFFRDQATASDNDFYWSSVQWRDGQLSSNSNQISSFEVLDKLIDQLADTQHFPVLDQIVITGQSSGGRFSHVFAPSNKSEALYSGISFDYIVSESQYFYYPDGQRLDEGTNDLYTPAGCTGYDFWPFGFNIIPTYLNGINVADFNQNFVNRSVTYLLGNGNGSDPTLNTTDCSATLLGSTRYLRGENIFRYMDLVYPGSHNHSKTVANGITHNGSAIYQSPEFRALLTDLLD